MMTRLAQLRWTQRTVLDAPHEVQKYQKTVLGNALLAIPRATRLARQAAASADQDVFTLCEIRQP